MRLNSALLSQITDLRVAGGPALLDHARARPRRRALTTDGRLVILAADHPARMVTTVGDDPLRMGNRAEYLGRILRVLQDSPVDGLMGTPDILEDLLAADLLLQHSGRPPVLAERVLVGCMNRGGLRGHRLRDGRHLHRLHSPPDRADEPRRRQADAASRAARVGQRTHSPGLHRVINQCTRPPSVPGTPDGAVPGGQL